MTNVSEKIKFIVYFDENGDIIGAGGPEGDLVPLNEWKDRVRDGVEVYEFKDVGILKIKKGEIFAFCVHNRATCQIKCF